MMNITKERVEYLIYRVKVERLERTGADFPYYSDLLSILDDYAERLESTKETKAGGRTTVPQGETPVVSSPKGTATSGGPITPPTDASPGPTDADERAFDEWWTGEEMGDRYSRGFRALARDAWMASRPSAPRVSEADILETAMRIRFPAEEKAGVITEPLKVLLRSLGVSVESGEDKP